MKIKNIMLVILTVLIFVIFTACSSDEDKVQNDNQTNADAEISDDKTIGSDELPEPAEPLFISPGIRNMTTMQIVRDMSVGMNLGNTLDASASKGTVKQQEQAWGAPLTTQAIIQGYADSGHGVLRIPVRWANMLRKVSDDKHFCIWDGKDDVIYFDPNDQYYIDPTLLARVKEIVDWTLEAGMYAVINMHHEGSWFKLFPTNEAECMAVYETIWTQIAEQFKDYDDHLIFESQNEDLGWELDKDKYPGNTTHDIWGKGAKGDTAFDLANAINQKFVDVVRASGSNNALRHLLIAGPYTNTYLATDPRFKMPNDPANRMAISVHIYSPFGFSMGGDKTWGTRSNFNEIEKELDLLEATFHTRGYPVIVGEYGCATGTIRTVFQNRNYELSVMEMIHNRGMCPVKWDGPNGAYIRTTQTLTAKQKAHEDAYFAGETYNLTAGHMRDPLFEQGLKEISSDNIDVIKHTVYDNWAKGTDSLTLNSPELNNKWFVPGVKVRVEFRYTGDNINGGLSVKLRNTANPSLGDLTVTKKEGVSLKPNENLALTFRFDDFANKSDKSKSWDDFKDVFNQLSIAPENASDAILITRVIIYEPLNSDTVKYNVSFDSQGGSPVAAKTVAENALIDSPAATRPGYTFNGWFTAPVGGSEIVFPYTAQSHITMYAQWTEIPVNTKDEFIKSVLYDGDPSNDIWLVDHEFPNKNGWEKGEFDQNMIVAGSEFIVTYTGAPPRMECAVILEDWSFPHNKTIDGINNGDGTVSFPFDLILSAAMSGSDYRPSDLNSIAFKAGGNGTKVEFKHPNPDYKF